jgi:hypothetical protein
MTKKNRNHHPTRKDYNPRNLPCKCGSMLKYKKCCWLKLVEIFNNPPEPVQNEATLSAQDSAAKEIVQKLVG